VSHCIHYGACGGCAVDDRAGFDKARILAEALAKAGFKDAPVAPLIETPIYTRRRVDLAAARVPGGVVLGLHRARGTEIIDMLDCVLLDPRILALLPDLRILLRGLDAFKRAGSVQINWLNSGPDILLRLDADVSQPDNRKLIEFARAQEILRISTAKGDFPAELVVMLAAPIITLSGISVQPPPGGFLQASTAGEAAILAAVLAGLPRLTAKSRIVELYAGIGTLTFALAQQARVEAYEGAADALAALEAASRANNLAGRITTTVRDLARRPLQPADFAGRAAVVLDPPFAGAAAQMRFLSGAGVPRIIYVSCNPAALAADAFLLHRAGYSVLAATPIDQFPYSENLESVVVFGTM
jgi:23S rRNA (uracil1939-C5)-methyltransferase